MVAACLKNVVKAYKIALDIAVGVRDAVTHTGLGGKIYHHLWLILCKQSLNQRFICYTTFYERPITTKGFNLFQSLIFQIYIVIVCN